MQLSDRGSRGGGMAISSRGWSVSASCPPHVVCLPIDDVDQVELHYGFEYRGLPKDRNEGSETNDPHIVLGGSVDDPSF